MRIAFAAVMIVTFVGCAAPKGDAPTPAETEEAAARQSMLVGHPAPLFRLPDHLGRPVALEDMRGQWVVLYFYPKDDTPGCTCQATEFTGLIAEFRAMNARVIGVSEDAPEIHREFMEKHDLKVTLLSDSDHRVMEQYGAWVLVKFPLNSYGRVIRSTVIIDPGGTIRYHWPEVIPQGHAGRVRRKLSELRAGEPK